MEAHDCVFPIKLVYLPDPEAVSQGLGSERHDTEVVNVPAHSLDEARKRVMLFNTVPADGRIVEMYDAEGNQLFGNF